MIKMRKKQGIIFVLTAGVAAFSLFLIVSTVNAQQGVGIKISPIRFEDIVDPGQTVYEQLTVTNESNTAKTMYPYLRDFQAEGEEGEPRLIPPGQSNEYGLAAWIDISGDGISFEPGESRTINYTIRIPADASPGGYYGAVLFGTEPPRLQPDNAEHGAGMAVAQQAGSLVLLRVKGEVQEEARIREFTTGKRTYNTPFDIEFLTRIENLGNVHVKPNGFITIRNMLGREVDKIALNDGGANILPKSIRRFTQTWSGKMGFGRYTANLAISYGAATSLGGQGKQSIFGETTFWIMPWKIIIPVLTTVIVLLALFVLLIRLYRNKAVRRAMEQAGLSHVRFVRKYQGPSPVMHMSIILLIILIVIFMIIAGIYFLFFA